MVSDVVLVCIWLLRNLESIRHDVAAAQIHSEILGMRAENERWTLGRPPADEFFGLCDKPDVRVSDDNGTLTPHIGTCGAQLFGPADAKRVDCPACGASYTRAERHESMIGQMRDRLATVRQAASTLTMLDRPVTIRQIDNWIRRGGVPTRGKAIDEQGRMVRTVRIGDVLDQRKAAIDRAAHRKRKAA